MFILTANVKGTFDTISSTKVAKNPVLVYGSECLMVEKDPFGGLFDGYTSVRKLFIVLLI